MLHAWNLPPFPWRRAAALLAAFLVCTTLWAEAAQTQLAGHVIRLHVLANSDSAADQALKLQVRDAVLAHTNTLLARTSDAGEATRVLEENLSELTQTARQEIAARGSAYPVAVRLEETWFPTRTYENVSLPAGNYLALRVLIGEAAGKNWWCVVFPSLCVVPASDWADTAVSGGLTEEDVGLMSGADEGYELRFKCLELWDRLVNGAQE